MIKKMQGLMKDLFLLPDSALSTEDQRNHICCEVKGVYFDDEIL